MPNTFADLFGVRFFYSRFKQLLKRDVDQVIIRNDVASNRLLKYDEQPTALTNLLFSTFLSLLVISLVEEMLKASSSAVCY
jgi:hypothetical protein